MGINKDIIIQTALGLIFLIIFIKIFGAVFDVLKSKLPGMSSQDHDIDQMIKQQKERLRRQYGLSTHEPIPEKINTPSPLNATLDNVFKEARWGGGHFNQKLKEHIAKIYSYSLSDSKINSFILLAEKKNYLHNLNSENLKNEDAIKNYLSLLLLSLIFIDEIKNRELSLLETVAKKCQMPSYILMISFQMKILQSINLKNKIKEDRFFSDAAILHQFSDETLNDALMQISKKEANLWAKGHNVFFEELSLFITYADILSPIPIFKSKHDIETSLKILNLKDINDLEEIKKNYKKIALIRHPDKIAQMKLPAILENKAISKFKAAQLAYETCLLERKNNAKNNI